MGTILTGCVLLLFTMNINILDIAPVLSDVNIAVNFLRGRNLLSQDYMCCGHICSKVRDSSLTDTNFSV